MKKTVLVIWINNDNIWILFKVSIYYNSEDNKKKYYAKQYI